MMTSVVAKLTTVSGMVASLGAAREDVMKRYCMLAASLTAGLASEALAQGGPLPVDVATPVQDRVIDWDEYTGRFEAVDAVDLRARVSGYLEEVRFRDGQRVERGDVLFVIDQRPFRTAFARAEAERQAAIAEQTRAAAELIRAEELVANRTVSESVLDTRRAEKLQADAQVAIADAALTSAELDLEFSEVRAPFSGRISDSYVDIGNLVTAGDTELARIVSLDPIHLVFTASEADFLKYARLNASGARPSSRGSPNAVQARLIDETGWPHQGEMNFVAAELDTDAGTITGRAIFANPDDFLTPGLFARLRLIGSAEYDALLLPDEAVLSDQARKVVMIVEPYADDDPAKAACADAPCERVVPRVVEPGAMHRGLRVIRSGLAPDDRVIVSGVQRARPGGPAIPEPATIEFRDAGAPAN